MWVIVPWPSPVAPISAITSIMADATAASADELDDADESGQHWDGGHEGDAITDTQAFDIVGAPTPHTPESLSLPDRKSVV